MLYFYAFLYKKYYPGEDKESFELVQATIEKAFDKSIEACSEASNKGETWDLIKIISNNIDTPKYSVDRTGHPESTLIHTIGQNSYNLSADELNYAIYKFQNEDVYPMADKLYELKGMK